MTQFSRIKIDFGHYTNCMIQWEKLIPEQNLKGESFGEVLMRFSPHLRPCTCMHVVLVSSVGKVLDYKSFSIG